MLRVQMLGKALLVALLALGSSGAIAQEEDFNTSVMRATIKLQHERSTATGFLLTRPSPADANQTQFVLVTANHVLENTPGDETTLIYRTKESEGTFKKVPTKLAIRKEGKPLWVKHPTDDVAALIVTPPENVDVPKVSSELLATDEMLTAAHIHPGDTLAYVGYPHRVESNDAGFALLRMGAIASYPLLPTAKHHVFLLSANTFEGDSGSPVFLSHDSRVVPGKGPEPVRMIMGLVSAQQFIDEEVKTLYGSSKMRHRLGLALIVQASMLRETVKLVP
ncbi:MAG: trypsin-like peptidase domain-containing protein [Planctomycetaceae bacterium]